MVGRECSCVHCEQHQYDLLHEPRGKRSYDLEIDGLAVPALRAFTNVVHGVRARVHPPLELRDVPFTAAHVVARSAERVIARAALVVLPLRSLASLEEHPLAERVGTR